ncbi:MAG: hypothetical protein IKO14_08765 [Oscillibacter sp.]|nr:hypothetical protein [Oscillibacter sp.]
MKRKRFISMVFALVMALTLAVPAFSAMEERKAVFQAVATTTLPTINVDISQTQTPILLNPYNFVMPNATTKKATAIEGNTIHVKNMTVTDLMVSAAVTGSTAGAVSFSSTSVASTITAKKAFVYGVFEVKNSPASVTEVAYKSTAANQVLVKASTQTKKDVAKLPAASETNPNYLAFGVFGNCTTKPKSKWTEDDTLSVAVAYSFRMVPIRS